MATSLSPGAQEVLHDLVHERGLTYWRVVHNARVSKTSDDNVDAIYGRVLLESLQEDRIDRRRKRKLPSQAEETAVACCFLVLPATSARAPVLSIQRYVRPPEDKRVHDLFMTHCMVLDVCRLLDLQQCAVSHAVAGHDDVHATQRTFLCLTDARNISYYQLQSPASFP